MGRFHIEDLRGVEGQNLDPNALSAILVKLVLSSSQVEANVFDTNEQYGTYVVVLQGTLDIGERRPIEPGEALASGTGAAAEAAAGANGGHVAFESHPACPPLPPEDRG